MIGLKDYKGRPLPIDIKDPDGALLLRLNDFTGETKWQIDQVATGDMNTYVQEPHQSHSGSEIGPTMRDFYLLRMDGTLRAKSVGALYEAKMALARVFDPALASLRYPDDDGALLMDFVVPVNGEDNEPSTVPSRYYVKSRKAVVPVDSVFTGLAAMFSLELLVWDPWRYSQTLKSRSGNGAASNLGDAPLYPVVTITMAGAGHATYTLANTAADATVEDGSLVLNLSGQDAADVIVIDMRSKSITKYDEGGTTGTDATSLYVSGSFWQLGVAANTVAITNGTNATTVVAWREAWSV